MTASVARRSRVGVTRWLVVAVAVAGVAVLHGVQCAAGMAAPLLAPPAVVHAVQDRVAAVVDEAGPVAASPGTSVAASPVSARSTAEGHRHRGLPGGAAATAGACLVLLTAVAGLLLVSIGRDRHAALRPVAARTAGSMGGRRPSLHLDQLCVSRT